MTKLLSELLQQHCSIRTYKSDPIPAKLIEEVCQEAIIGGSSSGNLNSVSMVLTQDPERKKRLYELHYQQDMVLQAPLLITFCADWFRTRQWLKLRGARDNFNNLLGYHVALVDAIIVAQNVCLGFEARGLGICYMGTTLHSMTEIAEYLALPDTCLPITTIVVGYPDENPTKRDRLPLSAFLHQEKYQQLSDTELAEVYRSREDKGWQRYLSMPTIRAEIEAHDITSLAEFYTSDAKYSPQLYRRDSEKLAALLREKHFLP